MLEPESRGEAGFRTDLQRADGPFHDSEQRQCELDCTMRRITPLCGSAAVASWSAALPQYTLSAALPQCDTFPRLCRSSVMVCRSGVMVCGSAAVASRSAALPQSLSFFCGSAAVASWSAALPQHTPSLRLCHSIFPLCGSAAV